MRSIGESAFSGCTSLTHIELPCRLTFLAPSAFESCSNLMVIEVDPKSLSFSSRNGLLYNYSGDTLLLCPPCREKVTLPQDVKCIESYAFFYNRQLRQIELPEGLERIESSAFAFCENLKRVRIPKSVDYVADCAFAPETKLIGFKKHRKPHILSPLTRLWLSISGWGEAVFYLIGFFVDSTFKRMQCRIKHEPVPSYRSLLVHRGFGESPGDEDDNGANS